MFPYKLKVQVNDLRPDFRVFSAYFFGDDFHNYNSEGNSIPVYSREWTELYMQSRVLKELAFDISPITENPLMLEVSAKLEAHAYQIAYFLALKTSGAIWHAENGNQIPLNDAIQQIGNFPLDERLKLAAASIWNFSCKERPYPNLE